MKFPDWVLDETQEYLNGRIKAGILSEPDNKGWLSAQKCALADSNDIRGVWQRVTKIYPSLPFRGQIWLLQIIEQALPSESCTYMTKPQSEIWRNKVEKQVKGLLSLMDSRPVNLVNIDREAFKQFGKYFDLELTEGLYEDDSDEWVKRMRFFFQYKKIFEIYLSAVSSEKVEYDPLHFGKWLNGENAERAYFIRCLSQAFYTTTGQLKRKNVATLASVVFDCDMSEQQVTRIARHVKLQCNLMDLESNEKWLAMMEPELP